LELIKRRGRRSTKRCIVVETHDLLVSFIAFAGQNRWSLAHCQ